MSYFDELFDLIEKQHEWRSKCINLIASENVTSPAVREAIVSDFSHRYAEGLLGGKTNGFRVFDRFYQGTKYFDRVEALAIKLAEDLFKAEHANVVPISGAMANLTVYSALAKHGDKISGLSVQAGGHISHTHVSCAGVIGLRDVSYVFDNEEMNIDVDGSRKNLVKEKPKIMMLGASLLLFPHPVREMKKIADEIGSTLVYDAAHVLGLFAGGRFQDPLQEGADVVTSSTHKSFPGPQGGLILCRNEFAERVDNAAFPGLTSNHHLHHVAGLVVALAEMQKFSGEYAEQIVKNAKALAQSMHELGFNVLCEKKGFTESHQVVVDVSGVGGGDKVANDCEKANIILNKNLLPWDTLKMTGNPSGIRIGVPEVTHIGMKESEMEEISEFLKRITLDRENPTKVKADVIEFMKDYNKVHYCFESHVGAYEYIRFK
ncbi:MAG: serine hydroxymethyltransferase [Candidatus Altiarchaeota archaeon]|nr:serine hydroxymethyltransferase [Candidatus Altiarchaeota archaeon]